MKRYFKCVKVLGYASRGFIKGEVYVLKPKVGKGACFVDGDGFRWDRGITADMSVEKLNDLFEKQYNRAKFIEVDENGEELVEMKNNDNKCTLDKGLVGKKVVLLGKTAYYDNLTFQQMKDKGYEEVFEQEKYGYVKISSIAYCHAKDRYYYVINDNFYNRCDFKLYDGKERVYAELVETLKEGDRNFDVVKALYILKTTENKDLIGKALRSVYNIDKIMMISKGIFDEQYSVYFFDKTPDGKTYSVMNGVGGKYFIEIEEENPQWSEWKRDYLEINNSGMDEIVNFRTKGDITQVKIIRDGKSYRGQTKCLKGDKYDLEKGKKIAWLNAVEKYRNEKLNHVKKLKEELIK